MRRALEQFINSHKFPCVGAKSALAGGGIEIYEAVAINRPTNDAEIFHALCKFGRALDFESPMVQSFAAVFRGPKALSEYEFETALWDRLQALHNLDVEAGYAWDTQVSSDPESPHFSMSIGQRSYFVVGLHAHASRTARRFQYPTLVFNSHVQFENLKKDGRFEQMQAIIRTRDNNLDGFPNPMLDEFGHSSEARQYSGRNVNTNWKCPLIVHRS